MKYLDDLLEPQDEHFTWDQENSIFDASTFLDLNNNSKPKNDCPHNTYTVDEYYEIVILLLCGCRCS